jgi:2,5-diketo-D-gluconate reductase A
VAAPAVPTTTLRRGAAIPQLGLGTWPLSDTEAERAVAEAAALGYRLFDTAENYGNEAGVGRGLRASGVPRDELFVITKFNGHHHSVEGAATALDASIGRLGLGHVDLLLIHWPLPKHDRYVDAWLGLLRLVDDGRLRAIGVSNFTPAHIDRLLAETGEAPDLNQLQCNPMVARVAARAHAAAAGIAVQSWAPIGKGGALLADPAVTAVARRHGRTPAQVVLRWHLQQGLLVVPKSSSPARMAENIDVFDFELSADEVAAMSALDRGEAAAVDADAFGH